MKQVTWTTTDGREVNVTAELQTSRDIYSDGDRITVRCCEINVTALVAGKIVGTGRPVKITHPVVAAKIGALGITAANLALINEAIAEIEAGPEWTAKVARQAEANKAEIEYKQHYAKMIRAMDLDD
jgi:hypothetical protein